MKYELVEEPDAWRVEAIDREGDGESYITIFAGPNAKERAEEYAKYKSDPVRQTYGQAIADAVERYVYTRLAGPGGDSVKNLQPQRNAKAALAREIDELVKFCVSSCPCNGD